MTDIGTADYPRFPLAERARGPSTSTQMWTAERTADLRRLASDGLSASQIAAELGGVSRNAVIGKAHRDGVTIGVHGQRKVQARAPAPPKVRAPRPPAVRITGQGKVMAAAPVVAEPVVEIANDEAIPLEQRRPLVDLHNQHCRWPVGDPQDPGFFFCGHPSADLEGRRPYCATHARMAADLSRGRV